jgi:AcrR family transcriptional regulator
MSKNVRVIKIQHPQASEKMDRRVRRTRDALGDALVALIQEKPFDDIKVQDVLDRAKVGRSTFYLHYRDKEDLFMSDAEEFFEAISEALSVHGDRSDRVAPVREFFAHVREMKKFVAGLTASGKMHENMELARGHFARGIERRLKELPKGKRVPAELRAATAHAHAGALIALLLWWINHGMKEAPEEMDRVFHRTVWGE